MTWFKVDDQFHVHAKTAALSFAAKGLWLHAGTWCSMTLSDGFVPLKMCKAWHAPQAVIDELVEAGLWETQPGDPGYWFHDWLTYQPSRAEVLEKREADRRRKGHKPPKDSPPTPRGFRTDSERNPDTPGPGPGPILPENKSYPDAADASHAHAREDFGGGGSIKSTVQPEYLRATSGAAWLSQATGQEPFSTNSASKHYRALVDLAAKPEAERALAARVLAREAEKPDIVAILTPQHVVDNWRFYGKGEAPGKPLSKASSGEATKWRSRVQQSTKKLEELKERRSQLQPGPNYASLVYDLDKAIREETDALERRKRELHALTG